MLNSDVDCLFISLDCHCQAIFRFFFFPIRWSLSHTTQPITHYSWAQSMRNLLTHSNVSTRPFSLPIFSWPLVQLSSYQSSHSFVTSLQLFVYRCCSLPICHCQQFARFHCAWPILHLIWSLIAVFKTSSQAFIPNSRHHQACILSLKEEPQCIIHITFSTY